MLDFGGSGQAVDRAPTFASCFESSAARSTLGHAVIGVVGWRACGNDLRWRRRQTELVEDLYAAVVVGYRRHDGALSASRTGQDLDQEHPFRKFAPFRPWLARSWLRGRKAGRSARPEPESWEFSEFRRSARPEPEGWESSEFRRSARPEDRKAGAELWVLSGLLFCLADLPTSPTPSLLVPLPPLPTSQIRSQTSSAHHC